MSQHALVCVCFSSVLAESVTFRDTHMIAACSASLVLHFLHSAVAKKKDIIFMSMFSDTDFSHERRNEHLREQNSTRVAAYAISFPEGRLTFLGPGDQEQWYGRLAYKPHGGCSATAENMMNKADVQFSGAQAHHPGECSQVMETDYLQYTSMRTQAQRRWWLLKTIIGVCQFSTFGAVAKWCNRKGAKETLEFQEICDSPCGC